MRYSTDASAWVISEVGNLAKGRYSVMYYLYIMASELLRAIAPKIT